MFFGEAFDHFRVRTCASVVLQDSFDLLFVVERLIKSPWHRPLEVNLKAPETNWFVNIVQLLKMDTSMGHLWRC